MQSIRTLFRLLILLTASVPCLNMQPHGLGAKTFIWASGDWKTLEVVAEELILESIPHETPSYNVATGCNISLAEFQERIRNGWVSITGISRSTTNCHVRIALGSHRNEIILCTPTQEFYLPKFDEWRPAIDLEPGDKLLNRSGYRVEILDVSFVAEPLEVYAIAVEHPHTFFVSSRSVLTHNMALPAINLAVTIPWDMVLTGTSRIAIGLGTVTCGVSIALAASSGLACAIYRWMNHPTEVPTHELIFDVNETSTYFRDKQHKSDKKQKLSSQNNNTPSGNDKEPNKNNHSVQACTIAAILKKGYKECKKIVSRNLSKKQQRALNQLVRKTNDMSKSEYFNKIQDRYICDRSGIWRLKPGKHPVEGAYSLEWDPLHGEVEAYCSNNKHLGAIDPNTNKLYKSSILGRKISR